MSDPHSIVHGLRTETQRAEQNAALSELVKVLREQAADARASARRAWWVTIATVVIAAGSLSVAIIALTIG